VKAPIRAGFAGVLLWFAVEFGARDVLGGTVFLAWRAWRDREPPPGEVHILNAVLLLAVVMGLLAIFDGLRRRAGLDLGALAYRFSWLAGAAGVACGGVLLALIAGTEELDSRLFGPHSHEEILSGLRQARHWAIIPLLIGNGTMVPIVEEFAWRGYVQTSFARVWGAWPALWVTAVLFALKHVIVDLSMARTITLVTASVILGLIRHFFGTLASTLAHYTMNFVASTVAIVLALTP
jgi:membrane protease YdiL (CAAX protease family)